MWDRKCLLCPPECDLDHLEIRSSDPRKKGLRVYMKTAKLKEAKIRK